MFTETRFGFRPSPSRGAGSSYFVYTVSIAFRSNSSTGANKYAVLLQAPVTQMGEGNMPIIAGSTRNMQNSLLLPKQKRCQTAAKGPLRYSSAPSPTAQSRHKLLRTCDLAPLFEPRMPAHNRRTWLTILPEHDQNYMRCSVQDIRRFP